MSQFCTCTCRTTALLQEKLEKKNSHCHHTITPRIVLTFKSYHKLFFFLMHSKQIAFIGFLGKLQVQWLWLALPPVLATPTIGKHLRKQLWVRVLHDGGWRASCKATSQTSRKRHTKQSALWNRKDPACVTSNDWTASLEVGKCCRYRYLNVKSTLEISMFTLLCFYVFTWYM